MCVCTYVYGLIQCMYVCVYVRVCVGGVDSMYVCVYVRYTSKVILALLRDRVPARARTRS